MACKYFVAIEMRKLLVLIGFLTTVVFVGNAQDVVNEGLKKKLTKLVEDIEVVKPNASDPVALNADMVWSDDKSQLGVVIKANIFPSWNIYAFVPSTQPFIATEPELELPKGITPIGEWKKPAPQLYEQRVLIYKGQIVFSRFFKVEGVLTEKDTLSTGLYYQACDANMCFPPRSKAKKLVCK